MLKAILEEHRRPAPAVVAPQLKVVLWRAIPTTMSPIPRQVVRRDSLNRPLYPRATRDAHNRFDAPVRKVDGPPIQTQCLSIQDQEAIGCSPISLVGSSRGLELEDAMKPSGRLLHRRQGVQRTERDLLSVLIAEGSLSSDWLVKRVPGCALKPPMGSEPPPSDAADPVRPGAG
jgi:hypothetical protein